METWDGEVEIGAPCQANPQAAWDFLLTCAASPFTSEHRRRLRRFAESELDWNGVLRLATVHGLLPVVHERLIEMGEVVSDRIRRDTSESFERHARQTLWLTHLLFDVSDLFQRHGIEALPYKGPVLAQLLHGNVTARQYSDIDILVRPPDVPGARLRLEEAGFETDLQLSERAQQAYIAAGYEFTFHSTKRPNVLELQWRILPPFQAIDFDTKHFFDRAQKVEIAGKSIATLGTEDLLLVLCSHAAKHAWFRLSWTREVAELAQSPDLDWDQVIREAGRLGILRIIAATFCLAEKLFRAPVPAMVQRLIDVDGAPHLIAEQTRRSLQTGAEPDLEALAYFRFMTQLRERRMDRFRFWWRLAATPSVGEWDLVRLPVFLFPLYRAVRVARLGARLVRSL